MKRTILATGGAGFIGSHVVTELIEAGYKVVILDNFENSDPVVIDRIQQIAGVEVDCIQADVCDRGSLVSVLGFFGVDAVVHLAGKKSVGESVSDPILYYNANLNGGIALLSAMQETGVKRLVFSSSATVYGVPDRLPIDENAPTSTTNPYGNTKLILEQIIGDFALAWDEFAAISLRYFNPVGAHKSGLIGENPRGAPNNLFPYVAQTAAGLRHAVQVFGDDYQTKDGTGLRDYIHVTDLARGHVAAIDRLLTSSPTGQERHRRINLGTGQGHTVLEVIRAFSQACGNPVNFEITGRRLGDVDASVADPSLAQALLSWRAEHGLSKMCNDHWRFQIAEQSRSVGKPPPEMPIGMASENFKELMT